MPGYTAAEVVELVRQIRHDYLNHFQVISGYLELEMPERGQLYISDIIADAGRERELLSLQPPEWGLAFYQLYMHWRLQGIILEFAKVENLDAWMLTCFRDKIEKLIRSQGWRAPEEGDLVLQVRLDRVNAESVTLTIRESATEAVAQTVITRE